jgi:hypothetical protein
MSTEIKIGTNLKKLPIGQIEEWVQSNKNYGLLPNNEPERRTWQDSTLYLALLRAMEALRAMKTINLIIKTAIVGEDFKIERGSD